MIPTGTFSAYAQYDYDVALPDPGILPNSPSYGLKRTFELIGTLLTIDNEAKALRALDLAQSRLAEARTMTYLDRPEFVSDLLDQYSRQVMNANSLTSSLQDENGTLSEKIASSTSKDLLVLDDLETKLPENAIQAVNVAKGKAMTENIRAIEHLSHRNPDKAADIALRVASVKLNDAFEANQEGDSLATKKAMEEKQVYEDLVDQIKSSKQDEEKAPKENQQAQEDEKQ